MEHAMHVTNTTSALAEMDGIFRSEGFGLWKVGGAVRDEMLGLTPADIDLATDATPEEQLAIYEANGIRHEPTGLKHGTVMAIHRGEIFEVTTLRQASDGTAPRAYTRDLTTDLGARDFTINAMAMTIDGTLTDPFGGLDDLMDGRVRFVGDAGDRIREDHLRILRWFRFLGRFADGDRPRTDRATWAAVRAEAAGLAHVSVERIWSEMKRILTGRSAVHMVRMISQTGVADAIGLPLGYDSRLEISTRHGMDAATSLGGYLADFLDEAAVDRVAIAWRLSNAEKHRARFVAARILDGKYATDDARLDLIRGRDRRLVLDAMRLAHNPQGADDLEEWTMPAFPVTSADLLATGMEPGPEFGRRMKAMKERWSASGCTMDADELLARTDA